MVNFSFEWGRSSVGRAPAWHAGGRRFEPDRLHHSFGAPDERVFVECFA